MGNLQKALQDQIANIPRMLLKKILVRKISESGVEVPDKMIDSLVDNLLQGNTDTFLWNDGSVDEIHKELHLSFDDKDLAELDVFMREMPERIQSAIESTIEYGGKKLYQILISDWPAYNEIDNIETSNFTDNLTERWGKGLSLLRMMLTVAREMGHEASKRYHRSKSKSHINRRFVLVRLHIRACQVADEIITLLENGFADGAMARWRTLHEIDVVAAVIEDGDEELAQRYIDHEIIDQKKMIDDWDAKQVPLGYKPVDIRTRKDVEQKYEEALRKYGSEFRNEYGWASQHLNLKRPDFRAMQHASEQSGMSIYYKLANYNVHAGSRSMFVRLTDLGYDLPIAGRSNSGLLEPGQNTAFTLTRITAALLGRLRGLDRLIEVRALTMMRDAAQKALERADRRLQKDETKLRRDMASRKAKNLASPQPRSAKNNRKPPLD
ncbi:MAG: DUF5677 domain-containing protein [Methylobacterium frigidaeris]